MINRNRLNPFTATQFTATFYESAEDKARVAGGLVRFILSDFERERFTPALYRLLSNTFGHIAEYGRDGFYERWFVSNERRLAWLVNAVGSAYRVYGDPRHSFSDVEDRIADHIRASGLIERYEGAVAADIEREERATLARLQEKYGGTSWDGERLRTHKLATWDALLAALRGILLDGDTRLSLSSIEVASAAIEVAEKEP